MRCRLQSRDELPGGVGQPGHRAQLLRSDREAAGLPEPLQPGDIGLFEADPGQQVFPLGIVTAADIEPAECRAGQALASRLCICQRRYPVGIDDNGNRPCRWHDCCAWSLLGDISVHWLKSVQ
jgi:hypothetical protein